MKQSIKAKSCLIVCDGTISKRLLLLIIGSTRKPLIEIISVDGASNTLYRLKITPKHIVGDLDSIHDNVFEYYLNSGAEIRLIREQEHNDFEKALMFALSKHFKKIFVTGFAGKRIDHTVNNLSVMKKYKDKVEIILIDDTFEIFFSKKSFEFDYRIGETLSLVGMPAAYGITTYGLKYPLKNRTLEYGKREGALNEAVTEKVKIKFRKGDLLVFKKHFGKFKL